MMDTSHLYIPPLILLQTPPLLLWVEVSITTSLQALSSPAWTLWVVVMMSMARARLMAVVMSKMVVG